RFSVVAAAAPPRPPRRPAFPTRRPQPMLAASGAGTLATHATQHQPATSARICAMKLFIPATALITVLGIAWGIRAADDPPADRKQNVMEQKLSHAQGILSGLARQDFAAISRESTD